MIQVLLDKRTLLVLPTQLVWKRMFSKTHQYGLKFREYPEKNRGLIQNFVREYEARLHRMAPKVIYKA